MRTKQCRKCKKKKSLEKFYSHSTNKDGKHSYCKECAKKGASSAYKTLNQREAMVLTANKRRQQFLDWANRVKQDNGCCSCEETEPICLDFHHLDSSLKDREVSKLINAKSPKALSEMKKCVVACANCHRKVHGGLIKVYKKHLCKINHLPPASQPRRRKGIVA